MNNKLHRCARISWSSWRVGQVRANYLRIRVLQYAHARVMLRIRHISRMLRSSFSREEFAWKWNQWQVGIRNTRPKNLDDKEIIAYSKVNVKFSSRELSRRRNPPLPSILCDYARTRLMPLCLSSSSFARKPNERIRTCVSTCIRPSFFFRVL